MTEYISREAVLSKCANIWDNADETTQTGVDTINTIDKITDFIESLPATDVQPVRHGRWECVGHDDTTYWYRCSVCGHEEHDNMTKHDNFCPNCGARMDGDANG